MNKNDQSFPLFKGATRTPTIGGVPLKPLFIMCLIVASIAMLFSLYCWILAAIFWFIMAQITKKDDMAFRIWGLWIKTTLRNNNKPFWGASTYSTSDYRLRNRRLK